MIQGLQNSSEHEGELYAVELDALLAINPDEFDRIILETVDEYFDQTIYQTLLEQPEHQPRYIDGLVSRKVRFLD
jgi:hypothetical protein